MALNVRKHQIDALVKLLHFNDAYKDSAVVENFKVLVIDEVTLRVTGAVLHTDALRKHGVTLVLTIEKGREAVSTAPVIYFIRPTQENVAAVVADLEAAKYKEAHVNFLTYAPRVLLESLATGVVKAASHTSVAAVYDQYLGFIALEPGLFTLGMPDSYIRLNNNQASESELQAAVSDVVDGLLSVCVTLNEVPVIRCVRGGLAEHVARALSAKIVSHLKGRGGSAGLFADAGSLMSGSSSGPLLALFDRNFDLAPLLRQPFTYKALVHDCLGLDLNKVEVRKSGGPGAPAAAGAAAAEKFVFEVTEDDAFWQLHGHEEFGVVAAEIDTQLKQYQDVISSVSKSNGGVSDSDGDAIEEATKALMTTVRSLPELRQQKKKLDGHMNVLFALLSEIQGRKLDSFHKLGQKLMAGTGSLDEVLQTLRGSAGSASDKLRLALLYLLVADKLSGDDTTAVREALGDTSATAAAALQYVQRMRQMKLTGAPGGSSGPPSQGGGLMRLVDSTLGSGIAGHFEKHFSKLVGGTPQPLMVTAVSQLMDDPGNSAAAEDFVTIDPRSEAGHGRPRASGGSFADAIVFVVGGGNYSEREGLVNWAHSCTPRRNIVYGATSLISGAHFCEQLATLGQNSGVSS